MYRIKYSRSVMKVLKSSKTSNDLKLYFQRFVEELILNYEEIYKFRNFGKIKGHKNTFHCHLNKGRPRFVAVWRLLKDENIIEVIYVGTHEKAPY